MPLKKGEAENIFKHQMDTPINYVATYSKITGKAAGYDEEAVRNFL